MPRDSSVFVDSNVLLYAASGRPVDRAKATRARRLLEECLVVLSVQVLQEFYANAVNPHKLRLTPAEAAEWCSVWLEFPIVPLTRETFVHALELAHRYHVSNWDAAILAAAAQANCTLVYSEDLNDGQEYDGIRVENPFRSC